MFNIERYWTVPWKENTHMVLAWHLILTWGAGYIPPVLHMMIWKFGSTDDICWAVGAKCYAAMNLRNWGLTSPEFSEGRSDPGARHLSADITLYLASRHTYIVRPDTTSDWLPELTTSISKMDIEGGARVGTLANEKTQGKVACWAIIIA